MQKKVLLTGAFSTGKTTLLYNFRDSAYIVPEVAREFLSHDPGLQLRPEFQMMLLEEQLKRELEASDSGASIIICDRGLLDIVCYSRFYGFQEPEIEFSYDKIFLCSPEEVPCVYGQGAEGMRKVLHEMFVGVLQERGDPYTVLVGSLQERLFRITDELILNYGKERSV